MNEALLKWCIERIGHLTGSTFSHPYDRESIVSISTTHADILETIAFDEFDRMKEGYIPLDIMHLEQEVMRPLADALELRERVLDLIVKYKG